MSLLDALRAGVRAINSVTHIGLQSTIGYYQYIGEDVDGVRQYNPPINTPATQMLVVVDQKQIRASNTQGDLTTVATMLVFVDIIALMAATNNKGVSTEDLIFLPDGTTQPIKMVSGFMDSGTGVPVATEVVLGWE